MKLSSVNLSILLLIVLNSPVYALTCRDIRGAVVADFPDYTINDVAIASLAPDGAPIIRYNPNVLSRMSPQTREFFYAHECGHHALGHNFGTTHPLAREQAADCFAINKLYELRIFSGNDIRAVQDDIARFGVADWTHLPGPQRAINLRQCLSSASDDQWETITVPCNHPAHQADCVPCSHPAHLRGDVAPCSHPCPGPWGGVVPCHPMGDVYPCSHPLHPNGDCTPCNHPAHPEGHTQRVRR